MKIIVWVMRIHWFFSRSSLGTWVIIYFSSRKDKFIIIRYLNPIWIYVVQPMWSSHSITQTQVFDAPFVSSLAFLVSRNFRVLWSQHLFSMFVISFLYFYSMACAIKSLSIYPSMSPDGFPQINAASIFLFTYSVFYLWCSMSGGKSGGAGRWRGLRWTLAHVWTRCERRSRAPRSRCTCSVYSLYCCRLVIA